MSARRRLPPILCLLLCGVAAAQPPAAEEPKDLDPLAILGYEVTAGAAPGYVADRACQTCHAELYRSFQAVGMARSFYRPSAEVAIEDFEAEPYYHEPSGRFYRMRLSPQGDYLFERWQLDAEGEPIHRVEQPVDWILGSGNHSRTYLFQNAAGELYQLPIAWYSQTSTWRMAPGFEAEDHLGLQRRVRRECMFCHNAYPDVPEGSDERGRPHVFPADLPQGIGCQRCHGPGADHVRTALTSDGDPQGIRATITNPGRLPQQQRIDICYGCHMQPSVALPGILRFGRGDYSFRPGEELADYRVALDVIEEGIEKQDRFEINHHPYRLEQSTCFERSSPGELDCLTCHDPHRKLPPEERAAHYRSRCLSCHQLEAVHPGEAAADCVSCHMPERRTQDVIEVTMTDHRIQIPPHEDLLAPLEARTPVIVDARLLDQEADDALAEIYRTLPVVRASGGANRGALQHLERLLAERPIDSVTPYLDLAMSQLRHGQYETVMETAREILERAPGHGLALEYSALALARSNRAAQATELMARALEVNPSRTEAHLNYALILRTANRDREALEVLERAVALRPNMTNAWFHLADIHHLAGRTLEARMAYRRALAIDPSFARAYLPLADLLLSAGERTAALRLLRHGVDVARPAEPLAAALRRLLASSSETPAAPSPEKEPEPPGTGREPR